MAEESLKQKVTGIVDNVKYYWKEPPKGKFMSFKEIVAYSFGGIGAYFIICMCQNLIVNTTNMFVGAAIGVGPTDMYILYIIATLANIPLTAVRANMIDNTRGKAGKYRPYLISMGLPTALLAVGYVCFPYEKLGVLLGDGNVFGKAKAYVATCAVVLLFNLLLQFFFNFFNDAYTNLIHVLSPNTQERSDVLAVKSVVYSLAPSIMNIVLPIVAQVVADNDLYDLRVYRISYPVFAVIGMLVTILIYANTEEKIVQAKTHTIQISFIDSLKEVAKNKYFWIISLAGWLGFLEGAYGSILQWSYTYGHTCNGGTFAVIQTLTGNASLWGMLLAPFCIRKWGKKKVLLGVNFMNIVCILSMIIYKESIWWLFIWVYFNWMFGAFEQITTPAIQADIRDYQQYRSGERIDGMFAAVLTIGNVITLLTSGVLPAVQKSFGIYEGNGYESPYDILDVTTGQSGLLYQMMTALILMAALGAFLNMVPYFFYDFTERKQKSVVRVLKVRAMFEDYSNNALNNHQLVEAIDLINNAREMAVAEPKEVSKAMYKNVKDKAEKKLAKKAYKDALEFNEEIEISKFVCAEIDKFQSDLYKHEINVSTQIYNQGIDGIKYIDINAAKVELAKAKALPKKTEDEKAFRTFEIDIAKKKISCKKAYDKYYGSLNNFVSPSMENLTALFDKEDDIDEKIFELVAEKTVAKKEDDKEKANALTAQIKALQKEKKNIQKQSKDLQNKFAKFNRAAKLFNDAKKLLAQEENFTHFDEIAALYDEAKFKAEEEDRIKEEEMQKRIAEEKAELERKKALKAAKKNNK